MTLLRPLVIQGRQAERDIVAMGVGGWWCGRSDEREWETRQDEARRDEMGPLFHASSDKTILQSLSLARDDRSLQSVSGWATGLIRLR